MLKTLVVLSCDTLTSERDPATPNIVLPDRMLLDTRLASPLMVCLPVRYVPAAISCAVVPGVIVAAAFVGTDAVKLTELFVAVPDETYPALTTGVTLTVFDKVRVFVPVDTVADVPLIVDGADADPEATDLLAEVE